MTDDIEAIAAEGGARLAQAATLDDLRALETELLGKRSELSAVKQRLGSLEPDERKTIGRAVNEARSLLEAASDARRRALQAD
ncbi:MAG: phenylalanyl-tRNA synthetase alpha chain, partial [Acidimicrobiaceae bacterium]